MATALAQMETKVDEAIKSTSLDKWNDLFKK